MTEINNTIHILDCTLRDGGWVNDFSFGSKNMCEIVSRAEKAGIELVELGYMDQAKGSAEGRSMYADFEAFEKNGLSSVPKSQTRRFVMIDYGKFPADQIPERAAVSGSCLDGIRICFHKNDLPGAIRMGREVLNRGYELFMQPMVTTRYTDEEFAQMLEQILADLPEVHAIYIVDSFGAMDFRDMRNRLHAADEILPETAAVGLHVHNNRGLSFPIASSACKMLGGTRELYVDCAISGMGKGAGDLETEIFAEYMNGEWGSAYGLDHLRSVKERILIPLREKYQWGRCEKYELTAKYRTTPSYANMFCRSGKVTMEELEELLAGIPDDKKDSFDRIFAEAYLNEWNGKKATGADA